MKSGEILGIFKAEPERIFRADNILVKLGKETNIKSIAAMAVHLHNLNKKKLIIRVAQGSYKLIITETSKPEEAKPSETQPTI